ncbi:MAG TPA: hypothetical protein ENN42_08480 [Thioalkalivibrio sp.]|nr:hypothetical protein [Thioalkalivibrio sp.]
MSLALDFAWGLLLLPLPWLARILPPARLETAALWVPFFATVTPGQPDEARVARPRGRALVAWLLLVLALAQPVLILEAGRFELYRPLLLVALLLALGIGLLATRRPRRKRRLPERYYRDDDT